MTDAESVITAIERDPSRFDAYAGDLRTILESGDVDARRSVAQLLGDVAEVDPQIGTRHPELLELAFEDADSVVRGLAVHVVAAITATAPEAGTDFVPHLATALADEALTGSSQISGIRALASIDRETATSVSEADKALATLLHDAPVDIHETVAVNLDDTVKDVPQEFPALLRAFETVIDDPRPRTRLRAAETLTTVAYEDTEALHDIDAVLAGLRDLRFDNELPAERVEKMIDITRVGAGYKEKSQKGIDALRGEKNEIVDQIEDLDRDIEAINGKIERVDKNLTDNRELIDRNTQLMDENKDSIEKRKEVLDEREKLRKRRDKLQEKIMKFRKNRREMREEKRQLRSQKRDLQRRIENHEAYEEA